MSSAGIFKAENARMKMLVAERDLEIWIINVINSK